MSQKSRSLQILNRESLKLIAMIFMLLDHAYMTVVSASGFEWMTQLGRMAFPIFAFQIVEGYTYTSNKSKYIRNMFLFALLSEIPFNLMMGAEWLGPFHQNVMFTFFEALLFLRLLDKVYQSKKNIVLKMLLIGGICILSNIVGTLTFVDYYGFGVLTVLIFYIAKRMSNVILRVMVQIIGLFAINYVFLGGKVIILSNGFEFPEQAFAMFSLIFIWCYNGKKALHGTVEKVFKYGSYLFYPVHILILSIIALYVL